MSLVAARGDVLDRPHALVQDDGKRTQSLERPEVFFVLVTDRLLDELDSFLGELAAHLKRRFDVPPLIRVHPNRLAGTRDHAVEERQVSEKPHFHLENVIRRGLVHFAVDDFRRVDPDRERRRGCLGRVETEDLVEGLLRPLADDVPERDVERRPDGSVAIEGLPEISLGDPFLKFFGVAAGVFFFTLPRAATTVFSFSP